MKLPVLFLDQQAWRAGGQRVLEDVLEALREDINPIMAFPEDGPFAATLRSRNVETLFYPLGSYRPGRKSLGEMLAFPIRSLVCGLKLARFVTRRGIRLIYINGPRCLPAGVLAAKLTGRPSLFHLHRTLTRQSELLVAARAALRATRIVACSQASADALVSANPKLGPTMQVVYNPAPLLSPEERGRCQLAAWELPIRAGPIVGFVGRFTPGKGLHVLIEAAARLCARWPQIQIDMVGAPDPRNPGDTSYVHELEARVSELGLGSNVRWAGYHSNPGPHFAHFDVLALPSVDNGDGIPMVALEAAQWGVPVVAARAGGIPEVIRNGVNGLLVPPGDEKALATALERVLGDPALRAQLATGARASLDQRFSPETFRTAIRGIVSELVSPSREAPREKEIEARA